MCMCLCVCDAAAAAAAAAVQNFCMDITQYCADMSQQTDKAALHAHLSRFEGMAISRSSRVKLAVLLGKVCCVVTCCDSKAAGILLLDNLQHVWQS